DQDVRAGAPAVGQRCRHREGHRGRRGGVHGPVLRRRAGHVRGDPVRQRPEERTTHRDQRVTGELGVRPGRAERPAVLRRRGGPGGRIHPHSGDRAGASVPGGLVAAGASARLRARLRASGGRHAQRDRRRRRPGADVRRRTRGAAGDRRGAGKRRAGLCVDLDRAGDGGGAMKRPVTWCTGQWADLPFEEVARLAAQWGYDGLEIACWGDHLDVWRAAEDDAYLQSRLDILKANNLQVWAISNHLKGQAVCDDPIDERHQAIVSERVWGDGDPEGVRQRAAEELKLTAKVAARMGVRTVVGFTGSSIWQYVAMFPPVPAEWIDAGYQNFADRWNPIMDVFDAEGIRFALEVHPS